MQGRRIFKAVVGALVLGGALTASPASAATDGFPVSYCRDASGNPISGGAPELTLYNDQPAAGSAAVAEDQCGTGGAFELTLGANYAHSGSVQLSLVAPRMPGGQLTGPGLFDVTIWRSLTGTAPSTGSATYDLQVVRGGDPFDQRCFQRCALGSETDAALSNINRVDVPDSTSSPNAFISIYNGCSSSYTGERCAPTNSVTQRVRVYRISLTAGDDIAPVLNSMPSGPLVTPGSRDLRGSQTITYSAGDPQGSRYGFGSGGIWKAQLLLDGKVAAEQIADDNGGRCKTLPDGSFTTVTPCKATVNNAALTFDTLKTTNGTHTTQLRVLDAASHVVSSSTATVEISNPPVNQVKPTTAGPTGGPLQGQTLTSTSGDWAPVGVTLARQFVRCDAAGSACVPITGATGDEYTLTAADIDKTIRLRVTATNSAGSAVAASDQTAKVRGDLDGDGIPDADDPDIDGDGVANGNDPDPRNPAIGVTPADPGSKAPAQPTPSTDVTKGGGEVPGVVTGAPNGDKATSSATVSAAFTANGKQNLLVGYSKRAQVRGYVRNNVGQPISGAVVDVLSTPGAINVKALASTTVKTGPDGSFSYTVPARSSSRTVRFRYQPNLGPNDTAGEAALNLKVRASMTLKVRIKHGGLKPTVLFAGRLRGSSFPSPGQEVVIQVKKGRSWSKPSLLGTVRADGKGRFRLLYRPGKPLARGKYTVRAATKANNAWPYAAGSSRPAKWRVG